MPIFRYDATYETWYKGNTHIHSTASDGGTTLGELASMYAEAGYDFLCRTDHWVPSSVSRDAERFPLLWLDGIEIDGWDYTGSFYHVVCLGCFEGLAKDRGFVPALEAARAQGGVLILAHPHWTGNSLDEALRWGFHAVEVYNHICWWLNGKGDGSVYWNAMLKHSPNTLTVAADDAHLNRDHPGWNGGWIMVNTSSCSQEAIVSAIKAGRFYSTCGPEFRSFGNHANQLTVQTSPVRFIRLVGPAYEGKRVGAFDGRLVSEATFEVPQDWTYAYLEIEDGEGHRAWTNPLFVTEERRD